MVLVPRESKRKIFQFLLREGVIVVKKDAYLPKHQQLTDVANLHVMMVVKSLKSKGFLQEVYNWKWGYYFITNKGVAYLAKQLSTFLINLALRFARRHRSFNFQEEESTHRGSPGQGPGRRREARQTHHRRWRESCCSWKRPWPMSALHF